MVTTFKFQDMKEIIARTLEKHAPKKSKTGSRQCIKIAFWDDCKARGWSHDIYEVYVMLPFRTSCNSKIQYHYYPDFGIDNNVFGFKTSEIIKVLEELRSERERIPGYTTKEEGHRLYVHCLYFDTEGNEIIPGDSRWDWFNLDNVFDYYTFYEFKTLVPSYIYKGETRPNAHRVASIDSII